MIEESRMARRPAGPDYARRIVWLGVLVALACAAYTGAWFYFADRLQRATADTMAAFARDGIAAECENPTVNGFPFRIGLFCASVSYADPAGGVDVRAGGFRSAGQIYDPSRLVGELDGPARIEGPGMLPLDIDWQGLRASIRLAAPLPERLSVAGVGLTIGGGGVPTLAAADAFEAHMRANGPDIDLAASVEKLVLDASVVDRRPLPPLTIDADLTLADGVARVASRERDLRGASGTARSLDIGDGAAGMNASGPFSIDQDGLLNADMKVVFRDPNALSAILARAFPEHADQIRVSFSGLALLGNEPWLQLKVVRGRAMLGFIPLGRIPPIR
ncbi:MAG: DUF2125 domain-containing protein [Rhizobiaceae bacterium]